MPELPEVETIVRDLRPDVVGRTFRAASLSHRDVLRGVTKRRLEHDLVGARVLELFRRAKHAVFDLGEHRLIVQPGMTGALQVHSRKPSGESAKYHVLTIRMDDGRYLVYEDVRRLGTLLLVNARGWQRYHDAIGPEPLDSSFGPEQFAATLRGTRQAIKKALMDQKLLAGVGNIYANEALFAAGIDPSKPAFKLTPAEFTLLFVELRRILEFAVASQGTTIRDYKTGTGEAGNFQLELLVYGREHQPCLRCGTRLVGTHDIDARITVFCYRCQK